ARPRIDIIAVTPVMSNETFEKCSILSAFKEGEYSNHPRGIGFAFHGAGRNTLSISRIKI
ncbi:MAG: hypothetical protein KKG10_04175, partial [Proteobacteria bacterium]|nr:hypothetical protein [Pseudomonadota bacterium]